MTRKKISSSEISTMIERLFAAKAMSDITRARDALMEIGPSVVESLITHLTNKSRVSQAAFTLAKLGDARAVPALIEVSKLKNTQFRNAAVRALSQLGGPGAVEAIITVLEDRDGVAKEWERNVYPPARQIAIEALADLGDPKGIDTLTELLDDPFDKIQDAALKALRTFDHPKAKQAIEARTNKKAFMKDGKFAIYHFTQTNLGNPLDLEVRTEMYCVYCKYLRDPSFTKSIGIGECSNYGSEKSVVKFDDSCSLWEPNKKVRYWLSKGYMQHNKEGWPRKPWYQVFDDGPDGEKGTH